MAEATHATQDLLYATWVLRGEIGGWWAKSKDLEGVADWDDVG